MRSQEGAQLRLYRLLHKPLRALDATSVLGREVDHEVETALDDALGMSEVDGAGVGETMLDQTEIEREAEARRVSISRRAVRILIQS